MGNQSNNHIFRKKGIATYFVWCVMSILALLYQTVGQLYNHHHSQANLQYINYQIRQRTTPLLFQQRHSEARRHGSTSSRTSWPRRSSILTDVHTFSAGERTSLALDRSDGQCITSVRRHPCVVLGSAPEGSPAVVAQDDWWGTYISWHRSGRLVHRVSLVPCNTVLCDLLVNLTHLRWQAECL